MRGNSVVLLKRYSEEGENADLNDWPKLTVPALAHHLEKAKQFNEQHQLSAAHFLVRCNAKAGSTTFRGQLLSICIWPVSDQTAASHVLLLALEHLKWTKTIGSIPERWIKPQ